MSEATVREEFAIWRAIQKNGEGGSGKALLDPMNPFRVETKQGQDS